jgi:hypothetical protein
MDPVNGMRGDVGANIGVEQMLQGAATQAGRREARGLQRRTAADGGGDGTGCDVGGKEKGVGGGGADGAGGGVHARFDGSGVRNVCSGKKDRRGKNGKEKNDGTMRRRGVRQTRARAVNVRSPGWKVR